MRVVTDLAPTSRIMRRPSHSFQIRHRPFEIQPFLIAPVLPGETLKNALIQCRSVTDPLKNGVIGWWYEMYLFYCKHRDLPNSTVFQNMMLTYGADLSAAHGAATPWTYHGVSSNVDWVSQCLRSVVTAWFRDDNEDANTAAGIVSGKYVARIQQETWLDSVLNNTDMATGSAIAGGTAAGSVDIMLTQYELLREQKLTTLSYDEYLKTFGVRDSLAKPTAAKPELLRYVRDWTYPGQIVDPGTLATANGCSWSIAERADKDRFFSEPGFIFGVAVARPKVYLGKQKSAGVILLQDAMTWLPAMLAGHPEASLKKLANTAGPLAGNVTDTEYWVDVRDLFLYGDQYVNFAPDGDTTGNVVALPTGALQKKYVATADIDALFSGANKLVRADGVVNLTIAGSQVDYT